jgi:phosphoglycolate phosphatase-like HAD superfamily hydrolase
MDERSRQHGQCTGLACTLNHVGGDLLQDRVVPQLVRGAFLCDREWPVEGFAVAILDVGLRQLLCGAEVIGGVPETLEYLSSRDELTLFTKGHPDEQKLKLDRSGLGPHFAHTAIVKEKDCAAYTKLVVERNLDPRRAWMIGNSPKSDINPALECGLNAVFVPHAHTWVLEKQDLTPGEGRLLILEEFVALRQHF